VAGFRKRFYEALGEDRPAVRRWLLWARDSRGYLWITTVLAVVVSILNFLLLLALGVPYPFTWAFLSFIMSYVPNVGFIIALVPPVALAALQGSWARAVGVFVGYVAINFVSDNIFKPRFLKTGMDLPVAVSFLSVLLWGFILGPIGALVSVPMTMMVRAIFLEASPDTEQLALLLRSGAPTVRTKRRFLWWLRRSKGPQDQPPGNIPPKE
jgi:predicted PurR-regulated permease PerM